jgi:carbonic anhydrase/acetyltransferase-like protein (isoleucine patch superfamily)
MAIFRLGDATPEIHPSAWVAESAQVVGRVTLGENASVWYGAVVRADNDDIRIGRNSNIQDGSVLHLDTGLPLVIGDNVTVGHQVVLHGCTIGDGTLVGIQSVILNGARIGKNCLVGAGSLVTEGKEFPDGVMIMGSPAKVVRELTPEQIARLQQSAEYYVAQTQRHRDQAVRIDVPAAATRVDA